MNEFMEQFLIESRELIEQATHDLLALEHDPTDRARLDSAFRSFHTLKGGAGIVDFTAMADLVHAMEDLLSEVRTEPQTETRTETRATARPFSKRLIDLCLSGLDQMTLWLNAAEALETFPADADAAASRLVAVFRAHTEQEAVPPHGAAASHMPGTTVAGSQAVPGEPLLPPHAVAVLKAQADLLALPVDAGAAGRNGAAITVIHNILRHFGLTMPPRDAAADSAAQPSSILPPGVEPGNARGEATRGLRVDTARIDSIVKLAGELTVAKNALGHAIAFHAAADQNLLRQNLQKSHAQFERLTSELLRAALGARVLPLRQVFQRFPRLVRDMAAGLGKPVRLVTQGDATEADKTVVEALFEPILHILRNAVDHGIEPSA
ncbi:Hpt domain-containing protein, partial [Acidocella sp.]|uniref:Hpt domain-containing protein n=1 Tax=Acidocella sp. TaxID=50710 RepID=UPI002F424F32